MLILEKFSTGMQAAKLQDGRFVLLSSPDKNGDLEVFNDKGDTIGLLQKLSDSTSRIEYLLIESQDNSKIFFEEIMFSLEEALARLREDYDWVTWETEGGPTLERLFELKPDPEQLKGLFDTIGSRSNKERFQRWNVVKRFILLVDNPDMRGTSANLKFWLDKCLPLLGILKITL